MNVSDAGKQFIKNWEGYKLKPYKDVAGYWTVGIGHLMTSKEDPNRLYTMAEVMALFTQDLIPVEDTLNNTVIMSINQPQFDALASFIFNVGVGAFRKSTLLKKLNAGDITGAADQLMRWTRAGGRVVQGLVNRRQAERKLFLTGQYN